MKIHKEINPVRVPAICEDSGRHTRFVFNSALAGFFIMEEIWKDIKGYEGIYQASINGEIRSLDRFSEHRGYNRFVRGCVLKGGLNKFGYKITILTKFKKQKTITVHKLVAKTFIPNPDNKPCINHKNGIKTDNRVDNLEWCTHSENMIHAYNILGIKHPMKERYGSKNHMSKIVMQLDINDNILSEFESINIASKITGICRSTISEVCNGGRYTAGGYKWILKRSNYFIENG